MTPRFASSCAHASACSSARLAVLCLPLALSSAFARVCSESWMQLPPIPMFTSDFSISRFDAMAEARRRRNSALNVQPIHWSIIWAL